MKNLLKISLFLMLSHIHISQASVIEIPTDFYFSDNVSKLDWAWASRINVKNKSGYLNTGEFYSNTICEPGEIVVNKKCVANDDGWRFATDGELEYLKNTLTIDNFYIASLDRYIHAVQYWNTAFTDLGAEDIIDFKNDHVVSKISVSSSTFAYELFYVRDHAVDPGEPIPEPNIAILALIATTLLWIRRKATKA